MQVPFNIVHQRYTLSLFLMFIKLIITWAKWNADWSILAGLPRLLFLEQSPSGSILNRTRLLWLCRVVLVIWSESDSQDPSKATWGNRCEPCFKLFRTTKSFVIGIFSCLCVPSTWLGVLDWYKKIKEYSSLQRVPICEEIKPPGSQGFVLVCFSPPSCSFSLPPIISQRVGII